MAVPARALPATSLTTEVLREVYGEMLFSVEDLARATNGFSRESEIRAGDSSSVYKGVLGNRAVAIKRLRWWAETAHIPAAMSADSNLRLFLTELQVTRGMRHLNLLELLGVCMTDSEMLLVFDFLPNGSLDQRLQRQPMLTWQQRLGIAAGAACGLQYLHSCRPPIIHRDVKSANILLDHNLEAKVSDFGQAKFALPRHMARPVTVSSIMGTPGYMAPEYGHTDAITKAIDVFAFGVVLLELVTGLEPFTLQRDSPYLSDYATQLACEGDFLSLLDPRIRATGEYDLTQLEHVVMVAVLCLSPCPQDRPEMEEVVYWLERLVGPEP